MYGDPALDADTYHVNGVIHQELGNQAKAEEMFLKALKLLKHHPGAFGGLLDVYRKTQNNSGYVNAVYSYISNDFTNPYFFNKYIEYISDNGMESADIREDPEKALEFYKASLAAFKRLEKPPEGAMDALNKMIEDLQGN